MDVEYPDPGRPDILILKPSGELDLYSSSEFGREALARIVPGIRSVIVDCSAVSYMDSSGTGAIIHLLQRTRAMGSRLALAGLRRGPRQILAMVNLFSIIPEYPDIGRALEAQDVRL
jgi:anti-sigma B factor antagonist